MDSTDQSQKQTQVPLPLPPAQPESEEPSKLNVGSEMKFDALGPLVVNSDGVSSSHADIAISTYSHFAPWSPDAIAHRQLAELDPC